MGGILLKRKEHGWKSEIPEYAIDEHTERGRKLGRDDNDFFREGSLIKNKQKVDSEYEVKEEYLRLYNFLEERNESNF